MHLDWHQFIQKQMHNVPAYICLFLQFLACDSMLSALYAIVRLSIHLSHGWISQKGWS